MPLSANHVTSHRCSLILAFSSPSSLPSRPTSPTDAAKRRESRWPIILLRLVLFCFARIGEINELIHYNFFLHTKLFLLLLTSFLPLVFFPLFTTMSSTSGKLPPDCNVVGSSAGDVATEVRHICFANDFIFSFDYFPTPFFSSTSSPF